MKLGHVVVLLVVATALRAQGGKNSCVDCHAVLEGPLAAPTQAFDRDIHKKAGFSCVDCHGGDASSDDPTASMSRARGFLGKIDRRSAPARCARCHSDAALIHRFKPQQRVDQLAQYQTSVHGKRLAAGDTRVANCVDCHSVHDIREVRDAESPVHPLRLPQTCARCHADAERMKGYSVAADQFEKYRRSVHWEALAQRGDLSAPSCATCHGNHGAVPPGVNSVAHVCGTCHVVFEKLFAKSPHQKAFAAMGMAGCVVCHGNHDVPKPTIAMLGTEPTAVCRNCHSEGDKGYQAAGLMRSRIEELAAALARSDEILKRAERSGMEVSEARLEMTNGHESLIKARVDLHAFDPAAVDAWIDKGLQVTKTTYRAGEKALEERDFRRKGLALSLAAIVIAMAGLFLAVRRLEGRG
jgi:predicted CXXCH cytochrome family protein